MQAHNTPENFSFCVRTSYLVQQANTPIPPFFLRYTQPLVRAYDLGDNMISSSESAVLVTVFVNPVAAMLRPTDSVFEVGKSSATCG